MDLTDLALRAIGAFYVFAAKPLRSGRPGSEA
jgi:hypothetical protein